MFSGFPEETIQFFLDLRFHNNAQFFHEEHNRYLRDVQKPFYEFIGELAPAMLDIDPQMEVRPHKCLSRIHRDTRFTTDKSPYRDHLWLCFRHAAEPKDGSINYWFEFGPQRLEWGLGMWGENKPLTERFRRELAAQPHRIGGIIDSCDLAGHHMALTGSFYKRMEVPSNIPERLHPWYLMRSCYIPRMNPDLSWVYSHRIVQEVRRDFEATAPIYRMLKGIQDELFAEEAKATPKPGHDEW